MISPETNLSFTAQPRSELSDRTESSSHSQQPTVALLPWGDLFEDFFDTIDVTFETFRDEHIGSYMFGYVNALKFAGVRTVLFFVSARVSEPLRFVHKPTGARVCILPATKAYRAYRKLRRGALDAAGVSVEQKFSDVYTNRSLRTVLLEKAKQTLKSLGSYGSIPLRSLAQELRQEGCSAILSQEYDYPRFDLCVLLGKLLHLPVYATFQGGEAPESIFEYPLRALAFRYCDGLIIPSRGEIQRVRASYPVPRSKIAQVFNPIDLSAWHVSDRNAARQQLGIPITSEAVVYHGRIELWRKGLDVLLTAWQQVCQERPDRDLRLFLVGTGSDADKLQQQIEEMQLPGVMWLNQFVRDRTLVQQYLSAADVYTLPSRHEGFPVAPLEAMACGLPIVAANAPGISDIFEHGEASGGIVVPCGDAAALSAAIGRTLDDAQLRQDLARKARQRVEAYFSLESVGRQLRQVMLPQSRSTDPTQQSSIAR